MLYRTKIGDIESGTDPNIQILFGAKSEFHWGLSPIPLSVRLVVASIFKEVYELKYSAEFIENALVKAYSRGDRSIASVAEELNVKFETLKKWLNRYSSNRSDVANKEKRPQDWRRDEQLTALLETHALGEEELNAWCRERGLFPHHLEEWRKTLVAGVSPEGAEPASARVLRAENEKLKRELRRKEKALAEAAALLVLQKKFQALWEDEEK